MTQVTLKEAETSLAGLIRAARNGEEVVITDHDQPVARIAFLPNRDTSHLRPIGLCAGKFTVPDDFDAPIDL